MLQPPNLVRPDICVASASTASRNVLETLFLGMEEEGIPWHEVSRDSGDAKSLGKTACEESRLDVGVGVDDKNVVLCFDKLKGDKVLFSCSATADADVVRTIGTNAARIIKRVPFRLS